MAERRKRNKLARYYPDDGPLRRDLYPKHMEFFRVGKRYPERAIIAANRVGKSEGIGGYELALHLTGRYPHWWEGHKFIKPINSWAAGDTSKTVREIIQAKLLGPIGAFGTGLIPGDCLIKTTAKTGISDAIDTFSVRHASGGASTCVLKSYDQRREAFQGSEQDVIWLDEEPEMSIYAECLLRTMATGWFGGGILMCTFTPLKGMSEVVKSYMDKAE